MASSPGGYNPQETQAHDRLPRERLRAVGVKRVVAEWLIAGVVLLAVNAAAFAALERYDPNRFRVQVALKYELLQEQGGQYDSLILGDSTPNQGVMPAVLNEQVGGSWLNLATVANMLAVSDAWLLQDFIERHGPPKRVLICHVPDMWPRGVDPLVLSEADVPILGFGELDPSLELSRGDQLQIFKTRYLPLYSKNDSLSRMTIKPWKIEDLRGMFQDDGFMPIAEQEAGREEAIQHAIAEHKKKPFKVSEVNEQAVQRIIALAEQHGIEVYLTTGSASRELAKSPGYRRNFDAMIEQYRAWAAQSNRLTVILPEPQTFADELMFDEDHVTREGAEVWTTRLAEAIRSAELDADGDEAR